MRKKILTPWNIFREFRKSLIKGHLPQFPLKFGASVTD